MCDVAKSRLEDFGGLFERRRGRGRRLEVVLVADLLVGVRDRGHHLELLGVEAGLRGGVEVALGDAVVLDEGFPRDDGEAADHAAFLDGGEARGHERLVAA